MTFKVINILEDPGGTIPNSCLQRLCLSSALGKAQNIDVLVKCSNRSNNEYF